MSDTSIIQDRCLIGEEETWAQEKVFKDINDWHQELKAVDAELSTYTKYAGKLAEGQEILADFWEFHVAIMRRLEKLSFYASMNSSVDSMNEKIKPLPGQFLSVWSKAARLSAFEKPELLSIGKEILKKWIASNDRLSDLSMKIDDLYRMAKFVRSTEVEEVLGMLDEPFIAASDISDQLTDTDFKFAKVVDIKGAEHDLTQSNIEAIKASSDREIRKTGWNNYADLYLDYKNTLAASYIGCVKQNVFYSRVRGYDSVLHMKLSAHNLPTEVFTGLIDSYKKHLPLWHRYWDVKRRLLKLPTFHPYDIWAPTSSHPPVVNFEQAVEWIVDGMKPMGSEYVEVIEKGCLQDRWVDRAINKGKRQGACSWGCYDTDPYIMMSYTDDLTSLSTLAHELGHSMHSYYTRKNQPWQYSDYSMFAAEVASNFDQAMVRAHLFELKKDDREFQLELIQEAMDNFHRYFFIMPTLASFEFEVFKRAEAGEALTADILNTIMSGLFAEGYGATMTDDPVRTGITWATFRHLYSPFYTFQYATGISAANMLARRILNSEPNSVDDFINFLSAGSSVYPLEALKAAGVDMTTSDAVETTFGVLAELIDRLESLIED